jgi:drug/metabolite transporter (DMT)-like permease
MSPTPPDRTAARADAYAVRVAVALGTVYLVWGSTYLGIRVVVTSGLPPMMSMGSRFLAAGAVLAAVLAARRGRAALRLGRAEVLSSAVVGLLLLLMGNGLVSVAERTVPSGLAALLVATTPLWLVVLGATVGRRTRTGRRPAVRAATWVGTLVGFAGTAVLARPGSTAGAVAWWGLALILTSTFCWALGSLLSGRLRMPQDLFVGAAYQMVIAGVVMLLVGLVAGEARGLDLAAVPPRGWVALVYLATAGSLLAYTAYYWLLGNAPLQLVSTYAYVNPVVAVLLGWWLLDEAVTPAVVAGGAVALAGVAIVITSERRGAVAEEP